MTKKVTKEMILGILTGEWQTFEHLTDAAEQKLDDKSTAFVAPSYSYLSALTHEGLAEEERKPWRFRLTQKGLKAKNALVQGGAPKAPDSSSAHFSPATA